MAPLRAPTVALLALAAGCRVSDPRPAAEPATAAPPPAGTPASRPVAQQPASPYPTRRFETWKRDPVGGCEHWVLTDVELRAARSQRLDVMCSTVLWHTYVPARMAAALGADDLGEVELPEPRQRAGMNFQLVPGAAGPELHAADVRAEEVAIDEPAHLRDIYCVNKTSQRRFRRVRIERFDLGVGPAFGPVEALVLDDANTAIGVLGRRWLGQRHEGRGFAFYAAENAVYFGRYDGPASR